MNVQIRAWLICVTALGLLLPGVLAQDDSFLSFAENYEGRLTPEEATQHLNFTGEAGQVIILRLESDEFDPRLTLYDAAGNLLAENDDFNGLNAQIGPRPLPMAGDYRVEVSGFAGETGAFTLSLDEAPAAEMLRRDVPNIGLMPQAGFVLYQFRGEAAERVIVRLESDAFDPTLELYAPDGRLLAANDDFEGRNAQVGALELPQTGDYLLLAQRYQQGTGAFTLIVETAPDPVLINLNQRVQAVLPPAAENRYSFDLSSQEWLLINVESAEFDPFMELIAPDGERIAVDDDSGGGINARLQVYLRAGEGYQLRVRSLFDTAGAYTFQLRPLPPPVALRPGNALRYNWQPDADQLFSFEGSAGQMVTLRVTGDPYFDSTLELLDPNGMSIATNDDAIGLDAALESVTLPRDGTYTLILGSAATQPGSYTLSLDLPEISPANAPDAEVCSALAADIATRLAACLAWETDSACYASADWQESPPSLRFDRAGDRVALDEIQALAGESQLPQRWSSASVQTDDFDLLLLGDVSIQNLGGSLPDADETLKVSGDSDLNLRAAPENNAPIIGVLRRDEAATADLRSEDGAWVRVGGENGVILGWVSASRLQTKGDLLSLTPITPSPETPSAALLGYSAMQAFNFQSGAASACADSLSNGILIHTKLDSPSSMLINAVRLSIHGSVFLQAQAEGYLEIRVLAGQVQAQVGDQRAAGLAESRLWIPLAADGLAEAMILGPKAHDFSDLAPLSSALWEASPATAAPLREAHRQAYLRYQAAQLGDAPLRATLLWTGKGDLDLQVTEPEGDSLSYQSSLTSRGGAMEREAIPCRDLSAAGLESAVWQGDAIPSGDYQVLLRYHPACGSQGEQFYLLVIAQEGQHPQFFLGSLGAPGETATLSFSVP